MKIFNARSFLRLGVKDFCRKISVQPILTHVRFASGRPASWDYETEKKTFVLKSPEYYNFARNVIDYWAAKEKTGERGDAPAFWWINDAGKEQKWSFQDLSILSKRVANFLTGPCKMKPGDKLIVILPRVPEWWLINIAAIRAGIILSPGTTLLRSSDIRYRLNASQTKCIITNNSCADSVDEVAMDCPSLETKVVVGDKRTGWLNFEELMSESSDIFQTYNSRYDEPMTVFFTSGTTGSPKMAEHTHSSYGLGHLITAKYFLDLRPTDILWNLSDTGWAKCAWSSLFAPWIAGACVFAQDSTKFDPGMTLKILDQYPISHFCAAPTAVRFMVKTKMSQYRFASLVRCVSAGEPVVMSTLPITVFCAPPTAVRMMQVDSKFRRLKNSSLVRTVCGGEPVALLRKKRSVTSSLLLKRDLKPAFASKYRSKESQVKKGKGKAVPPSVQLEPSPEETDDSHPSKKIKRKETVTAFSEQQKENPELLDEWKEGTGLKLLEGYGQTETTFLCGTYDSIEQRPGSMGKAAPGYDLQIVNTDGDVLPHSTEGEVGIRYKPGRPCGLFTRYIDDEIRMQKAFTGDFYLTGDRAMMDEEGYIWFVGRSDDVIVSSGYRIGPFEVESALLEHPAVLESAVVSSPDETRGEVVTAYVTLTEDYKSVDRNELVHQLQEHCKQVTAPYKYPRKIEFMDILPKTVSGKIRRVELRNKEWGKTESN